MSRLAVIALGSNQGDRLVHITCALEHLALFLDGLYVSRAIESPPAAPARPDDPKYLNAVAVGTTALSARALLDRLLEIERRQGRTRPHAGAPRTLDLDLVLLGDEVVKEPGLEVPHPRFRERRFVLEPLAEIAPDLIDPVTRLTVRDLLERVPPPPPS